MSDRKYPDIDFVETDTETIESSLIALYESLVQQVPGRERYKLYPASPERLFISWITSVIVQQRVLINETAKKNVPRYADGEYLDSLAELFKDIERLPASPASAIFRFYISEAQKQSIIIPKGTRISFDGAILFETTENLEIKAGNTYGDIEGVCTTAGEVGNNLAAGQVKEIVDLYDYYQKAENITATSGGAEQEDDASYYERMRESMESFSTAGPVNGYIYFTKSVSAAVSDVAVTSPQACEVDVRVLLQNGEQPTEAVLKEIEDALNASDIRPLTDRVKVSVPQTVPFDVDVTFYISQPNAASAAIIESTARQAVEDYISWQQSKMGRDINPSYLTAKLMEAGVKRVEVRKPVYTVVDDIKVAKLGSKTVLNGGIENV
ncbi:MAG: baseplate J/gp47 family protein [Phascolarctobacterium sp.]|nr:baseplate J/gp47 family protein [Candidatus Phascolarctobacterium caballi]